jgi:SAM-dependent methyltransferase
MQGKSNVYSQDWFDFFHATIDQARTNRETKFICHCAPLPEFRKILDLCCGTGRHARALATRGYAVVGVDRDADAIAKAREVGAGPEYVRADIRNYRSALADFDVAMMMGQSFGHFDDSTNREILLRIGNAVRQRGRVILDLWNQEFFTANQGERDLQAPRGTVRENKRVEDNFLFVRLEYPNGTRENFEWQLFTPAQMSQLAESAGLVLLHSCSGFDISRSPSSADPRIQFVLERGH